MRTSRFELGYLQFFFESFLMSLLYDWFTVYLQRGSWVAAGCSIVAGVTIGQCNLVAAGSVVTKDTVDYAIVRSLNLLH